MSSSSIIPLLSLIIILSTNPIVITYSSLDNCEGQVIFNFPKFNPSSCKKGGDLLCMGVVKAAEGFLNLTAPPKNSSTTTDVESFARVLYHEHVQIWPASFCTSFSFKIYPLINQERTGDGFTFVIAPDNQPSPNASVGSYLGLQDIRLSGGNQVQQLAVEFDTFKNEWDPDGNHIGIDTLTPMNSLVAKSLNSSNIYLKSGKEIQVKIAYDGWTKNLQIYVGYEDEPLISFLNQTIKVSKIVPKFSYIGFTAGTGLLAETHQIFNWVFTSNPLPSCTINNNKIKTTLEIVLPIIGALIIIIALCAFPIVRRRVNKKSERIRRMEDIERRSATTAPKNFTYKQLAKATKNFSKENLLGRGGFGSVYKGHIVDTSRTIAVKKISDNSQQVCDGQEVIFNFSKFNPSNCENGGDLLCMGAVKPEEGFLNLTAIPNNSLSTEVFYEIARVLYRNPVQIWPASFCTSFSFRIFPGDSYFFENKIFRGLDHDFTGDGMTFVITQDNQPSPDASSGSYLGFQDPKLSVFSDSESFPDNIRSN